MRKEVEEGAKQEEKEEEKRMEEDEPFDRPQSTSSF